MRVFISYSHDSTAHKDSVLRLATSLKQDGIDVVLDRCVEAAGVDWNVWGPQQVRECELVVVVCTRRYYLIADGRPPDQDGFGTAAEAKAIRDSLTKTWFRSTRFVPVLFPGSTRDDIPEFLEGYAWFELNSLASYNALLRRLTFAAPVSPPTSAEACAEPSVVVGERLFPIQEPVPVQISGASDRFAHLHRCKQVHEQIHNLFEEQQELAKLTARPGMSSRFPKERLTGIRDKVRQIRLNLENMMYAGTFPGLDPGWIREIKQAETKLDDALYYADQKKYPAAYSEMHQVVGALKIIVSLQAGNFDKLIDEAYRALRLPEFIQKLRNQVAHVQAENQHSLMTYILELSDLEAKGPSLISEHRIWQDIYTHLRKAESDAGGLASGDESWWDKLRGAVTLMIRQQPPEVKQKVREAESPVEAALAQWRASRSIGPALAVSAASASPGRRSAATALRIRPGSDPELRARVLNVFQDYCRVLDAEFLAVDLEVLNFTRKLDDLGRELKTTFGGQGLH